MRAYIIAGDGIDNLALTTDRPRPVPARNQVLLRITAASLNYRDLLAASGRYPGARRGIVPLSDAVGEVVDAGDDVTRVRRGDRVCGIFMQGWTAGRMPPTAPQTALGGALDGVLAEFVALHEDGVVHVPDHLTDEEAATLPCAAVTAWNALFESGRVRAGDTVLTQGTGGVSLFALQLAALAGARVLITSSSDDKLARAGDLGAHAGVNYRSTPDWDRWALDQTAGLGADHVVEIGGPGTLPRSLAAVRHQGDISMIGVLTGVSGEVPIGAILGRHARILGIMVGSREMFENMNRAIAAHHLRPVIDSVFPFDKAPDAYRHLQSGAHFGKVVIRL